jgi:hypothetical protein
VSQSAYIKLVDGSVTESVTLEDVKALLLRYQEQTGKTGEQLDWDYRQAAFPYTIETKPGEEHLWFYLKGTDPKYNYIVFGVGEEERDGKKRSYVQVVLPEGCTHGDKSKGNEFCKYIARLWKAELQLFNGRTMFFNPRK